MSFFDHFSETKSTRLGDWISRKTAMQEFSFIQQHLSDKSAHILEIGPGKGILANEFLSQGYHNYTVVEPNNSMRAKFEHAGISTKNYMLPEIHEDALSYDVIILVDVFEHLNGAEEAILFIKNAHKVLRENGKIFIACPDYLHWREDFFNCDYSHNNVTSMIRMLQLFYTNGFQIVKSTYMSGHIKGVAMATILSWFTRITLVGVARTGLNKKMYKLKLTFLRRFMIVASKI